MSKPKYLVPCPKCNAAAFKQCRTLVTNKTTDTHTDRIQGQFDNPDRETVIRRVLNDIYGSFVAEYMPATINKRWDTSGYREADGRRDELMLHIWTNTSGGTTAEYAAGEIRTAVKKWERI